MGRDLYCQDCGTWLDPDVGGPMIMLCPECLEWARLKIEREGPPPEPYVRSGKLWIPDEKGAGW